jgi:hypothetical protein
MSFDSRSLHQTMKGRPTGAALRRLWGGVDETPRQGSTSSPQASAGRRRAATTVPGGGRDEAAKPPCQIPLIRPTYDWRWGILLAIETSRIVMPGSATGIDLPSPRFTIVVMCAPSRLCSICDQPHSISDPFRTRPASSRKVNALRPCCRPTAILYLTSLLSG